jgi:hypothetical protein
MGRNRLVLEIVSSYAGHNTQATATREFWRTLQYPDNRVDASNRFNFQLKFRRGQRCSYEIVVGVSLAPLPPVSLRLHATAVDVFHLARVAVIICKIP